MDLATEIIHAANLFYQHNWLTSYEAWLQLDMLQNWEQS